MSDELDLRKQMESGARATIELETPEIAGAFDILEHEYFEAWKASPNDATAARERLWQACAIIGKVRSHLQVVIQNGEVAKAEIDRISATPSQG